MQQSQFHLLKSRRFLPLFVTQFLGAFNDNAYRQTLVILVTYGLIQIGGNDPRVLITAAAGISTKRRNTLPPRTTATQARQVRERGSRLRATK